MLVPSDFDNVNASQISGLGNYVSELVQADPTISNITSQINNLDNITTNLNNILN